MLPTHCELSLYSVLPSRAREPVATPVSRRAIGKPGCLLSGVLPRRASGSPGVLPRCFHYVTVESTEWAVRLTAGNWGCHVCCLLTPHPSLPVLADGVSVLPAFTVRSARIFVLGFLKVLFPELPLPSTTLHVTYHGAGLAHAFCPNSSLTELLSLVRSRSAPASSRARPAHNKRIERDSGKAAADGVLTRAVHPSR